jgi:hypothetical protein
MARTGTDKKRCPIPITHCRIKDIYELWHKAAKEYQDPESFRINLNAAIQEMRNITFILQSEKKSIPEFESWYSRWQKIMSKDEVLKWLKDARNKIVKQGDLEIHSIAKVKILTWEDIPILELEVPPFIQNEFLAAYFVDKDLGIPSYIREVCVLNIERRWAISEFPNRELLDLLAYGFEFLNKIIDDAHQQCGIKVSNCENYQQFLKLNLPLSTKTFSVSFSDQREMVFHDIPLKKPTKEETEIARRRYQLDNIKIIHNNYEIPDPFKDAEFYLEYAKRLLSKDKHHINIAFLYFPDKRNPRIMRLDFYDQAEKFLVMRHLADEVDRTGATGIIFISEAWTVDYKECKDKLIRASQHPKRQEALVLHIATFNGEMRTYSTKFNRGLFNRISFGTTEILDIKYNNFLEPVIKIWQEKWNSIKKLNNQNLGRS